MQLLQIKSTPMKYELEVENAKLEYQQDVTPSARVDTVPSELTMQSKNIEVRIDTYEARKSLGIIKIGDSIAKNAQEGMEHINSQTKEYVEIGKAMGNIQDGTTIADIYRQRMLQQPELYTAFLPSGGADISWSPAQLDVKYKPGDVNYDWQIRDTAFSYEPGSVRMKIVEYAHVDIEYLGGPMYVPPSADPDFQEPKAN